MNNNPGLRPLAHAGGAFAYIVCVVLFVNNMDAIIGSQEDTVWAPLIGLTLFVLSAAITSSLILGKPILLYLDGKKSEAVRFFIQTIGWLFGFFVLLILSRLF